MKKFTLYFLSILCVSISSFAQTTIDFEDFESGFTGSIWNDGGNDCGTTTSSSLNATQVVYIQDNTTQSLLTTDNIDLSSYASAQISFDYRAISMETGEDFWIQYDNGSGTFVTVQSFVSGTDFSNNTNYTDVTVALSGAYTFSVNSRFRIRCDASDNNDDVHIDNITIAAFVSGQEISVTGNGTDIVSGSTSVSTGNDTDFGIIPVSTPSVHTFTVRNDGATPLTTGAISITGSEAGDFAITGTALSSSIASGVSSTFNVTFTPSVLGARNATVSIVNGDTNGDESPFVFSIQGGVGPKAPGGVTSGLQLWMRTDKGVSTGEAVNNTEVTSWGDQSQNSLSAVKESDDGPTYIEDGINFNPILQFTRADKNHFTLGQPSELDITPSPSASNASSMSIFGAFLTNSSGAGTLFSRAGGTVNGRSYQLWLGDTDRVVHYTVAGNGGSANSNNSGINYGTIHARNEPKLSSAVIDISTSTISRYVNGFVDPLTTKNNGDSGIGNGENTSNDVLIGARRNSSNTATGNELTGNVGDIIIYDRALTDPEREKVETYLAIKYGITLGYNDEYYREEDTPDESPFGYLGTSNDYIASDDSVIWDGSDNAGYGYNVFGIARDDASDLLQTKSMSVNIEEVTGLPAILTIENDAGGLATDLNYLLIGNNGDNLSVRTTSLPVRATSVVERIWKTRESTTNPGSVKLEFDLTSTVITDTEALVLELFIADNDGFYNYKNIASTSYDSTTNIITFTGIDFEDGEYFTLGTPQTFDDVYHMKFDGVDDYLVANSSVLSGLTNVTMMGWINVDPTFTGGVQSVMMGQDNLEIYVTNHGDINIVVIKDGGVINGAQYEADGVTPLVELGIWAHIAVVYDGSSNTSRIYVNGVERSENTAVASSLSVDTSMFTTARKASTNTDFFKGDIDEVRVFNVALTEDQLQQIVYQEIEQNGSNLRGTIIPKDIEDRVTNTNVDWNSLLLYYSINKIRGNCLLDVSSNTFNSRFYNLPASTVEPQTAPMPFVTSNNGLWTSNATWEQGAIWDITDISKNRDWAIVDIQNNVTTSDSHMHLGLMVDTGRTLTVTGDNGIENNWYLDLNGTIDLSGDSQLVQTEDSDLTLTSAGNILSRQEGQDNVYRYNYWGSPVSTQSTTANNLGYSLNMLKDANGNIQFTTNNEPAVTTPATVSTSWTYVFRNGVTYYDWIHIDENTNIEPGTGYTQKGTGQGGTSFQYVFDGKPNNGDIDVSVTDTGGSGSVSGTTRTEYLFSNPYPSTIDAYEFIDDNETVIGGEIYFWEQWAGNTHVAVEYQGGYAMVNKMAGVRAYQILDNVGGTGSQDGTKKPSRYIAVGQGFFAEIENTGTIQFRNDQRFFKKESDLDGNYNNGSVFFRTGNNTDNTENEEPLIQKIRLKFEVSNGLSRELVLGFGDETTDGFDYGYDADMAVFNTNDLATTMDGNNYVMQAYSSINTDKQVDLVLNSDANFSYSISIVDTENLDASQDVYLWDTQENVYHDLRTNDDYNFTATAGEDASRFKIVFNNGSALSTDDFEQQESVLVYANNTDGNIYIKGLKEDAKSIRIINMLGQNVMTQNNRSAQQLSSGISTSNLSSGVYIIDMTLNSGAKISKKITLN